jgi:hypothetical protein
MSLRPQEYLQIENPPITKRVLWGAWQKIQESYFFVGLYLIPNLQLNFIQTVILIKFLHNMENNMENTPENQGEEFINNPKTPNNESTESTQNWEEGIPSQEAKDAYEAKKSLRVTSVMWEGMVIDIDHTQDCVSGALGTDLDTIVEKLDRIKEKKDYRREMCAQLPEDDCACMQKSEIGVEVLRSFSIQEIMFLALRGIDAIFDETEREAVPQALMNFLAKIQSAERKRLGE